MSLANNYVPVKQIGNGVTTIFTGAWNPVSLGSLQVFLEDVTTGVQTPVITGITTAFLPAGGFSVTFTTAPTAANYVVISRATPENQTVPYKTSKGFDGTNIETSFDKLTAMIQEQQDALNRSLKFPLGSTLIGILPGVLVDNAVLTWDGLTGKIKNGPDASQIAANAAAAQAAAAAAAVSQAAAAASQVAAAAAAAAAQASANRAQTIYYNITDPAFGAIADGYFDGNLYAQGTDNRAKVQSALNLSGKTYKVAVYGPAGDFCIGTNGPINTETALQVLSNTLFFGEARFLHNINNGPGCLIETPNEIETDTGPRTTDVEIRGLTVLLGVRHDVIKSKKALNIGHGDRIKLRNFTAMCMSTTLSCMGSYFITIFHTKDFEVSDVMLINGRFIGEDGIHCLGNTERGTITNCDIDAGDDSISFTQETSARANCVMQGITVSNMVLRHNGFSCIKVLCDGIAPSTNAVNAVIRDINIKGIDAAALNGGNLLTITNTAACTIDNIHINGWSNGSMSSGNQTGAAVEISLATNVTLGDLKIKNTWGRAVFLQNSQVKIGPNAYIGPYAKASNRITGLVISAVTNLGGGAVRYTFSGSPSLASIVTTTDFLVATGCAIATNNRRLNITSFDDTAKTINCTTFVARTSAQDETSITGSGIIEIRKDTDYGIQVAGANDFEFFNSTLENPGSVGINFQQGLAASIPQRARISSNTFLNCSTDSIMNLGSCQFARIENNLAKLCTANYFISDSTSTDSENNEIYGNTDVNKGCGQSYRFLRASLASYNNRGTNADYYSVQLTINAGSTTTTVALTNAIYAATSTAANLSLSDIQSIVPNTSLGSAKSITPSLSGSTYTFTLDTTTAANVVFTVKFKRPLPQ